MEQDPGPHIEQARSIGHRALAREFQERGLRGTFEIQRSGLLGLPELHGDLFAPLLTLQAASRAGFEVQSLLETLLSGRERSPLVYYRDLDTMPRDADDAALVLILAREPVRFRFPDAMLAQAREVIRACVTRDGPVQVWESQGQDWFGPVCAGVGARVLHAWAMDPAMGPPPARSVAWLLSMLEGEKPPQAVHYPSRAVASSLLLQCLGALLPRLSGATRTRTRDAIQKLNVRLRSGQQPDGSWAGSVVDTVYAALVLREIGALPSGSLRCAQRWLANMQRWDGLWPESGLFLCPHPNGEMRLFGSVLLSSALALALLSEETSDPTPQP